MNLIELHILQSFPVSCLNRDDLGSPKSAIFGGKRRARISSQCLKRAQRELFTEYEPEFSQGERTKLLISAFEERLSMRPDAEQKMDAWNAELSKIYSTGKKKKDDKKKDESNDSLTLAGKLAEAWGKLDSKKDSKDNKKSTTLTYLSMAEMEAMIDAAVAVLDDTGLTDADKAKKFDKGLKDAIRSVQLKDAADIALFGRMIANDPSMNVEGAAMFTHALSTHCSEPEIDFYAAVDDLQPQEESGAGMTGVLEFNSACYYRYIGINLDLLKSNMASTGIEDIKRIVAAFIRSALMSVPHARQNSMNAATLPGYVMGTYRSKGHPLQLVNAFEKPIKQNYMEESIKALVDESTKLQKTWGITPDCQISIPEVCADKFISELTDCIS